MHDDQLDAVSEAAEAAEAVKAVEAVETEEAEEERRCRGLGAALRAILESGDRARAAQPAPPQGLAFLGVGLKS